MSSGLYSLGKKEYDRTLDLTKVKPYGDTMNDGKMQLSFTLPIPCDAKALEAARELLSSMGFEDINITCSKDLGVGYTFFVAYASTTHTVDYTSIHVEEVEKEEMTMDEIDALIREKIGRKIVVVGACTGTDAHTVGIDAIMNMKGYAGHYGLERYQMIDAYNLGSQVMNEELLAKAIELKADAILISQVVTQKDVHISNLKNMVELMEAQWVRDNFILVCGGPRITHQLARELGYDAGFGSGSFAEDVAAFIVKEMIRQEKK
ncbi:MAG: OAM dimerization domain-containing protein [Thermoanaerobacteraceae bacterium]|nr:OAM dimerization domain-containing protein [Thermoanaerobacteraceae bacterium]